MNEAEQRIALAKACGWVFHEDHSALPETDRDSIWSHLKNAGTFWGHQLPDYLNDLNAVHEAEQVLLTDYKLQRKYFDELDALVYQVHGGDASSVYFRLIHSTADLRVASLLKALNLWKEST